MKKIIIISLGIILSTCLTSYAFFDEYEGIKKGTYKCPYREYNKYTKKYSDTCVVELNKDGSSSRSACPDDDGLTAKLIKSGKCTYTPDRNKYYTCKYPKGSCSVRLEGGNGHGISCIGDLDTKKALQDAKNGKCQLEK